MATTFLTRLKPEAKGIYSADTAYEANSLVTSTDGVRVYLSVKDAPAGTPLTDTNYFVIHTDLSATVQGAEDAAQKAAAAREEMLEIARGLTDAVEASGNPAQLELAGAIPFDSVETVLEPVQAGSGDPSPENIRAISGWTGAKIARCGKNLINPAADDTGSYSQYMTHKSDGSIVIENTSSANIYPKTVWTAIPAGTYAVHCSCTVENAGCYLQQQSDDYSLDIANDTKIITFTEDTQVRLLFAINGSTANAVYTVQLECGSTVTEFEPYIGDSYTVEFGDAVYGGTFNWTTGVMTVDRGFVELDGTETYSFASALGSFSRVRASGIPGVLEGTYSAPDKGRYSHGNYHISYDADSSHVYVDTAVWLFLPASEVTDLATAKAYVEAQYAAGTPIQFAYPLAEPYTIQLTPQEIKQLNGTNILYGDGTVQLQGRERPGQND